MEDSGSVLEIMFLAASQSLKVVSFFSSNREIHVKAYSVFEASLQLDGVVRPP